MDNRQDASLYTDQSQSQFEPLSSELKKLRLRISDYNKSPVIDGVCQKLWRLIVAHQYENTLLELISHQSTLPISIALYEKVIPLFQQALGIYYQTNYYVAKQEHVHHQVFYPRFIYDLVSLFGVNLFNLDLSTLEMLVRKVYQAVSFRDSNNQVKLRATVKPAFTEDEFYQQISKQKLIQVEQIDEEHSLEDIDYLTGNLQSTNLDAVEQQRSYRLKKMQLVKAVNQEKQQTFEFQYLPEGALKDDPVKVLADLKRKGVMPLKIKTDEPSQFQQSNQSPTKISPRPLLAPLTSLQIEETSSRHQTLKLYEHMQTFNAVDLDETMDMEEKLSRRVFHESIMKKLAARDTQRQLSQFLKYERVNLKSHLYNQSHKTDKMFKELNTVPKVQASLYQPILDRGTQSVQQPDPPAPQSVVKPTSVAPQSPQTPVSQVVQQFQKRDDISSQHSQQNEIMQSQQKNQNLLVLGSRALNKISQPTSQLQQRFPHLKLYTPRTNDDLVSNLMEQTGSSSLKIRRHSQANRQTDFFVKPKAWIHDVTLGDFQLVSWRLRRKQ